MNGKMVSFITSQLVVSILLAALPIARAQNISPKQDANQWVIDAEGSATATPDVVYLMMKMEYQAATAADAIARGDQQLSDFLADVNNLKIPHLTYQIHNTVITPGSDREGTFSGLIYARNIIFSMRAPQLALKPDELNRTIALLEDLGARHNSHCVTCVGSG